MAHFPLAKRRAFLYKVFRRAEVAQLVEQGTENPRVGSSILSLGTIFRARNVVPGFFFFRRERTGTTCRSAPLRAGLPERLCLSAEGRIPLHILPGIQARVQGVSGDAHTSASSSGSVQKSGIAALRTSRLSACLPRTALHESYGVMAEPDAPSPLPQSRPVVSRSRRLPALSCSSGRVPTPAALRDSRRPSALRPAPRPSFRTLIARAFLRALFPRFFPPCAIPSALVTPFPLRCTPPPRAAPRFRRAPPTRRREAATAKNTAASLRQKGKKE